MTEKVTEAVGVLDQAQSAERIASLTEALRDLIDAIPSETFAADPALQVWGAQAQSVLTGFALAPQDEVKQEVKRLAKDCAEWAHIARLREGDLKRAEADYNSTCSTQRIRISALTAQLKLAHDGFDPESPAQGLIRALERGQKLDAEKIATLTAERDKWMASFNRSEQFQDGPTKRAEQAEAALATAITERDKAVIRLASLTVWLGVDYDAELLDSVGEHIDKARASGRASLIDQLDQLETLIDGAACKGNYISALDLRAKLTALRDPSA